MEKWLRRFRRCIYLTAILMEILVKKRKLCRFILIGSPMHGNLGDHAISFAERSYLSEYFAQNAVIEISGIDFKYLQIFLTKLVSKRDIILITGGGFLGDLWINEEEMVRQVILRFPQNSIYIFPQTIFFSNDEAGQTELKKSKEIYSTHKRLYMFLRETNSYTFARKNYEGLYYVGCVPDMVLYLDFSKPVMRRSNILFCLREDKEKKLKQEEMSDIYTYFQETGCQIGFTSTVLPIGISFKSRDKLLLAKLKEFKESRLVITDRLHGMLFAAITATPCIALDNLSGKVKGVYEWISDLEYIKFAQSSDDIVGYAEQLLNMGTCKYDNTVFRKKLAGIAKEIGNVGKE